LGHEQSATSHHYAERLHRQHILCIEAKIGDLGPSGTGSGDPVSAELMEDD